MKTSLVATGGTVLGMSITVVTPAAAAARVPEPKSSFSVIPGSRKWTWASTRPGITASPRRVDFVVALAEILANGDDTPVRYPEVDERRRLVGYYKAAPDKQVITHQAPVMSGEPEGICIDLTSEYSSSP